MAAVPEDQRVAHLRRLGASEPLIRLSSGDLIHPVFCGACLGPPYFVDHGAGTPVGPPLVPLWDHGDTVLGVWERDGGLEFIAFSIEAVGDVTVLAQTEQGFWATRFDFLYECEAPLAALRDAAAVVGFRCLDRYLSAREVAEDELGTFDGHRAWLRSLIEDIDRESGGRT